MRRDALLRYPTLYWAVSAAREGVKIKAPDDKSEHWAAGDFESVGNVVLRARRLGNEHAAHVRSVRDSIMFIGNQRTGHSLVGSLLDAHPNVMVAHEVNALKLHALGLPVRWIDGVTYESSRQFAIAGRGESGYDYEVPGQYQGTHTELLALGDKDARRDTSILARTPTVLEKTVKRLEPKRLRVFHVVRNPFDTLSTIWGRPMVDWVDRDAPPPYELIDRYFDMCVAAARAYGVVDVCHLRHEDLLADPRVTLEKITRYLDLPAPVDWIDACGVLVRPSAHHSRTQIPWTEDAITYVDRRIAEFDFLRGYSFES